MLFLLFTAEQYTSEDILDVIYKIEDDTEGKNKPKDDNILLHEVPHTNKIHETRNNPVQHTVSLTTNTACGSSSDSNPNQDSIVSTVKNVPELNKHNKHDTLDAVDNKPKCGNEMSELHSDQQHSEERKSSQAEGRVNEMPTHDVTSSKPSASKPEDSLEESNATEKLPVDDGEVYKGGNTASKKKLKKKKKGSKTKRKSSASSDIDTEPKKTEQRHQPSSGDETQDTKDVWVDVRPKQSQNPDKICKTKNSKTKEDVTELVEENKKLLSAKYCRMCNSELANILLLPCRHLACCETCGEMTDSCPICGKQVIATVKTYMS